VDDEEEEIYGNEAMSRDRQTQRVEPSLYCRNLRIQCVSNLSRPNKIALAPKAGTGCLCVLYVKTEKKGFLYLDERACVDQRDYGKGVRLVEWTEKLNRLRLLTFSRVLVGQTMLSKRTFVSIGKIVSHCDAFSIYSCNF
jgi:hypothetical protein